MRSLIATVAQPSILAGVIGHPVASVDSIGKPDRHLQASADQSTARTVLHGTSEYRGVESATNKAAGAILGRLMPNALSGIGVIGLRQA